ncbi:MAG: membrane protein insertase YidC [Rhodothermaceae bacterium]|nr:membrane protein insertase YidC [Rhodothermaceae bacterium]
MDRNVITATLLITGIMLAWFYLTMPEPVPPTEGVAQDSTAAITNEVQELPPAEETNEQAIAAAPATQPLEVVVDSTITGVQEGEERLIAVESDLYEAIFSTKGATLVSFKLKNFNKFDQATPIQLVDTTLQGALSFVFTTPSNHNADTRTFFFEADHQGDLIQVDQEGDEATLRFSTPVGQGRIVQTYTFTQGTYEIGMSIEQENVLSFSTREGYDLLWDGAIPYSERDPTQELMKSGAYYRTVGGDVEGLTMMKDDYDEEDVSGGVSWIGVKNQYFAAIIMPQGDTRGAELIGERFGETDDPNVRELYHASLLMPVPLEGSVDEYKLYLGPMEYKRINSYDLGIYDMVDYGWDFFEWMTRPIARFVFIPLFSLMSGFIPSYGVIIIILAFLIKLVVYPLTKSSYRSMAQMRELQPKLEAIKEKHGEDMQKQQEATMKLYKESGVNPIGGCLPMLLQYPVIIALWQFLPQSIEIRQQGFLWANDLSSPDIIFNLPFTIPFYGDFVAGFCMLMGISMVIQMRIQSTPSANAQTKMIMYFMPIMIFVIFNRWASGLNLYYLCYNILTALQQRVINKNIKKEAEEEDQAGGVAKNKAAKVKPGIKSKKSGGTNGRSRNGKNKAKRRPSPRVKR